MSNTLDLIQSHLSQRILVLDGAMGTMIQRHTLTEDDFRNEALKDHAKPLKGNNDLLSITRPDIISDIHNAYFEAGSDFATTNTFSGTTIAQEDYALEDLVYELNYQSARIAKKAAEDWTEKTPEKPRWVIGSIGPTNKTCSLSPDVENPGFRAVTFNELKDAYAFQAKALLEGGADTLMIETVFDTLNARAALVAVSEIQANWPTPIPVMMSGTITDASGRTLSGQTPEAFWVSVSHAPLVSCGFNCALGADALFPHIEALAKWATCPVSVHPNAGLPNEFGQYDQTANELAEQLRPYLENKLLNIVGGCCGTTPEHIQAMYQLSKEFSPRLTQQSIAA